VTDLTPILRESGAEELHTGDGQVTGVRLIESLDGRHAATADVAWIGSRAVSAGIDDYQVDLVLRHAVDAGCPLIALFGVQRLSATAARIADRGRLAVFGLDARTDLVELLLTLTNEVRIDRADALDRLIAAHAGIQRAEPSGEASVLRAASRALGTTFRPWPGGEGNGSTPDTVVTADRSGPVETITATLVSESLNRVRRRQQHAQRLTARTKGQLLAELLSAGMEQAAALGERSRALGVPSDGCFQIIRVETARRGEPVAAHQDAEAMLAVAHRTLPADGRIATLDGAAVVVAAVSDGSSQVTTAVLKDEVGELLAAFRQVLGGRRVMAGIGGPHAGLLGIRAGAAEARGAIASLRATGTVEEIAVFDAAGLRRMLVEWLASDTARRSVDELLKPLDRQPAERARSLVETLQTYLDEQGSLVRAGRTLHLHPNAVAYRMRKVRELLESDLDDPDQRLALQIACRARLTLGRPDTAAAGSRRA